MEERQEKRWLTVEELAEYLSIRKSTVYDWTHRRAGPPFIRRGHIIRFLREDVDTWLEQYKVTPTSKELDNGQSVQKT